MFERDYMMRIVSLFAEAIRKSWTRAKDEDDPKGAAAMLEATIGDATEIDGAVLLSLAPESIAGVLQVSGTDPKVIGYVVRSLALAASYHVQANDDDLAALRLAQGKALADAYGIAMPTPDDMSDLEAVLAE